MAGWIDKIEPLVISGQENQEKSLVITAGKQAVYYTDGNENPTSPFVLSNQDLVTIIRDIAPEIIPMVQRGETIPGEINFQTAGNKAYHVVYRDKSLRLTIFIDRKEFELTPTSASVSAFSINPPPTNDNDTFKLPPELMENRQRLYLILSKNPQATKIITAHATEKDQLPYPVSSANILKHILDRFVPRIIVIDNSASEYSECFKLLYDITRNIRRDIFIALITKQFITNDPVGAFSQSVNVIINPNDISKFNKLMNDAIKRTDEFYLPIKRTVNSFKNNNE